MRKRLLTLAGVATAIGATVGAIWMTSAGAITSAVTFTVVAPNTEESHIDVRPAGPSRGDLFVFSGPLLRSPSHEETGRIDGHCVTTSVPGGGTAENRQQCFVTATIGTENGETEIELAGVGRIEAEDVLLAVTGGTGRYANVRGQALFDFTAADRVTIAFSLIP